MCDSYFQFSPSSQSFDCCLCCCLPCVNFTIGFYSFVVDLTKQLRPLCVLNTFCQPLQIILIHLIAQKHLNWFDLQFRSLEGILCSMIARIHWLPSGCGQWKMLETSHIGVKWAKGDYFLGPLRSCGMLTAFTDSQLLPRFRPFNSTELLSLLPSGNFSLSLSFRIHESTIHLGFPKPCSYQVYHLSLITKF